MRQRVLLGFVINWLAGHTPSICSRNFDVANHSSRADVIVIGAGISGASVTHEIVASASVILLGRESQGGYHSTGRSAASFTENYATPLIRRLAIGSRAFLDAVAIMAGIAPVGLVSKRRTAFILPAPAGMDARAWPMVDDVAAGFYFKPDAGHLVVRYRAFAARCSAALRCPGIVRGSASRPRNYCPGVYDRRLRLVPAPLILHSAPPHPVIPMLPCPPRSKTVLQKSLPSTCSRSSRR